MIVSFLFFGTVLCFILFRGALFGTCRNAKFEPRTKQNQQNIVFSMYQKKCLDFLLRIRYNSRATRRVVRAGRRSTTGNRVSRQRGFEGSNPLLSAKKEERQFHKEITVLFYFACKHTLCRQCTAVLFHILFLFPLFVTSFRLKLLGAFLNAFIEVDQAMPIFGVHKL